MDYSWSNSALNMRFDNEDVDDLIKVFSECKPDQDDIEIKDLAAHIRAGKPFTIYPSQSNMFIFDEEFIQNCLDPIQLFDYYKKKVIPGRELLVFEFNNLTHKVTQIAITEDSSEIFHELLDTIILDSGAFKKNAITMTPEIFDYLSKKNDNENQYCRFMSEFLSLMVISDRVISTDENLRNFEFQISSNDMTRKFHYTWVDEKLTKVNFWYECYKWITSDGQKSIDIKLKRNIVREVIAKKYTMETIREITGDHIEEMHQHFDNVLRLIVAGRSQEYFDTQKALKAEYVDIYSKNFDSFSNVVNTILGLIVALTAGLYGILFTQGASFDLFSPNKSVGMLFSLVLIAEIFVLVSTVAKFLSHRSYVKKLSRINCDKLLISEDDQRCLRNNNLGLKIFIYLVMIITICFTIRAVVWYMDIQIR